MRDRGLSEIGVPFRSVCVGFNFFLRCVVYSGFAELVVFISLLLQISPGDGGRVGAQISYSNTNTN